MEEPKQYIAKSQWTELPGDLRFKLRQVFGIQLTESSIVVDDRVISDGVSDASLRVTFNIEKMQAWLGRDGECDELFAEIVEKVRAGKTKRPIEATVAELETKVDEILTEPEPAKVEKPKRKTKKKTA